MMIDAIVPEAGTKVSAPPAASRRPVMVADLLADQQRLETPAAVYSDWHATAHAQARYYRDLIPLSKPGPGEQYAFEVNLDSCTGCKACVVACHSLNGLDDNESWRDVGVLLAPDYQQTVTTACHHCADPACANGCPTLAYQKDEATGIVRHLDDQCIGCSYCTMKCPYDVPKYNKKRGIVRKCDMCHGRLAAGEAPACVQACPSGAISIRIVPADAVPPPPGAVILPGAFESGYTRPTTRYISSRVIPADATPADAGRLNVEHAHNPLVLMLVFTQAAAGGFVAAGMVGGPTPLIWLSAALLFIGVHASVLHLGQPLKAWKAFLGWRKSWLSREIIAFGAAMGAAGLACVSLAPAWVPAAATLVAVVCSIFVYVDTRRDLWRARHTGVRFLGSVAILGSALAAIWHSAFLPWAAAFTVLKLGIEIFDFFLLSRDYSVRVMRGPLRSLVYARAVIAVLGLTALFFFPPLGAAALLLSELLERALFFRAVKAHRMPGL